MNLSRRRFAGFAGGLLATSALAACANTATTTSNVELYAKQVLAGLGAVLASPTIQTDLGANLAKAQSALAEAQAAYAVLTGGAGAIISAATQSTTQQISSDATTILGLVQMIPGLPASASTIVTAIQVVVPIMLASVGVQSTMAARSSMSLDHAQVVLTNPKV